MRIGPIATERLELIPATPESLRAALASKAALQALLRADVTDTWPHEYLDAAAFEFFLRMLGLGDAQAGWWFRFVVRVAADARRTLIGSAGYKGPPSREGTVEIGYGIVRDHRRNGYASEVVRALVQHAFALDGVRKVAAETLPGLSGSIGVLERCGFARGVSRPGVLRFELARDAHIVSAGDQAVMVETGGA